MEIDIVILPVHLRVLSAHRVHLCSLYDRYNKQSLFIHTALIIGSYKLGGVCLLRGTS
jgi:hypothetical protein